MSVRNRGTDNSKEWNKKKKMNKMNKKKKHKKKKKKKQTKIKLLTPINYYESYIQYYGVKIY